MKKFSLFLFCLLSCYLSAFGLPAKEMTGRKAHMVFGDVKQVNVNNKNTLEFNKDGNVTLKLENNSELEFQYLSATRYQMLDLFYDITFTDNARCEKWDNTSEDIYFLYTFDNQGRLIRENRLGNNSCERNYTYQDGSMHPCEMGFIEYWENGEIKHTDKYTYTEQDAQGNWICRNVETIIVEKEYSDDGTPVETTSNRTIKEVRKIVYFTPEELTAAPTYVSTTEEPINEVSDSVDNTQSKSGWWSFYYIMSMIVKILIVIAFFGHMIYVSFIRGPRYKTHYTSEGFRNTRLAEGKKEDATDEENSECHDLLNSALECWPEQEIDGEIVRAPLRNKQIIRAAEFINRAIAVAPTDGEVVDVLNEMIDVVNSNEKRHFDGSKKLIWITVVVGIVLCLAVGIVGAIPLGAGIGAYILASMTPAFLIDKRAMKGRGFDAGRGVMKAVFGLLAGASTYRVITTWSDGSKTEDKDDSEHTVALILAIIVVIFVAMLISFWALFNYIRNYWLYI